MIRLISSFAVVALAAAFGGYWVASNAPATEQAAAPAPAIAAEQPASDGVFNDAQQAEIADLVRKTLVDQPQILEEASIALESQRAEQQLVQQGQAIAQFKNQIFLSAVDPVIGNPDGDVTIVEFFDYNCPYCRRAKEELVTLIANDPNLRVVLKEFPVLSQESYDAALVGMAAARQDGYEDFHMGLMRAEGRIDQDLAISAAEEAGIDMDKLQADLNDTALTDLIRDTHSLADQLGITGTPSYIVGDRVFIGAVPRNELEQEIARIREEGCSVC